MEKPAWIDRIMSDSAARTSFIDFIIERENEALVGMRDALAADKLEAARVFAGESNAWKALRNQLTMYEREEEQNVIIQEQTERRL